MPTNFLSADTNFPRLTADEPVEKRLQQIRDYLYMLLEELRYTLANLGEENFNEQSLLQMGETMTGPLKSEVTDLAGNVSSLEQTATSLTSRISNAEGDISSLEQTATSLTSRISNAEGDITSLEQTASSLTTRVSNAEGDITQVTQTADKINWVVASGGTETTFTLTSHMASLVADEISITGVVTFNDLETAGQSIINGDNIELKADADGDSVSYLTYKSVNDNTFAEIYTRDNATGTLDDRDNYAFVIETPRLVDGDFCALKLVAGDSMSLESGHLIFAEAQSQIVLDGLAFGTRIRARGVIFDPTDSTHFPADTYCFCRDGIYYNGTRILST